MKSERGIVISGKVEIGEVIPGDIVIYVRANGERIISTVEHVESLGDLTGYYPVSNIVALSLTNIDESMVSEGDVVIK